MDKILAIFFCFLMSTITYADNRDLGGRSLVVAKDIAQELRMEKSTSCRKVMIDAAKYCRLASVEYYKNHVREGKDNMLVAESDLSGLLKKHCTSGHKIESFLSEIKSIIQLSH